MAKRIAIIGAGGTAREVSSCLQIAGWKTVAFRETPRQKNERVHGVPVVEHENEKFKKFPHVIALGDPVVKHNVIKKYYQDYDFPPLTPYNVYVGKNAKMKRGVFCSPGVILTCDCVLEEFVFVNTNSAVAHDASIGKYVMINPNCSVNGRTEIGEGTYLGAGVAIKDGVKIGKWSIIGMGSVVVNDIPDHVVAYGSPCKVVRKNDTKLE